MRSSFINTLTALAQQDERIYLLTADLGYSVLEVFADRFPKRFLNVGIAEQNAIGVAAGLALNGKIPYVYSIIPFVTGRCYEQIKNDVAYMNTNVRVVGVGAGYAYGALGATHHAIEDLAIMRALPNMGIIAPGCPNEVKKLVKYSVKHNGPLYIRLAKNGEPQINNSSIVFGKFSKLCDGHDIVILSTSSMLNDANNVVNRLKAENIFASLYSVHTLKPFDNDEMDRIINSNIPVVTLEEHNIIGGLASAVSLRIAMSGKRVSFLPIAIPDQFSHFVGGQTFIKNKMGLGDLESKIRSFLK